MSNQTSNSYQVPSFGEKLAAADPFNDESFAQNHQPTAQYGRFELFGFIPFGDPGLSSTKTSSPDKAHGMMADAQTMVDELEAMIVLSNQVIQATTSTQPALENLDTFEDEPEFEDGVKCNHNKQPEFISSSSPLSEFNDADFDDNELADASRRRSKSGVNQYTFEEKVFITFTREQTAWKWEYAVELFNERFAESNIENREEQPLRRNKQAVEFHYRMLKKELFSERQDVKQRFKELNIEFGKKVDERPTQKKNKRQKPSLLEQDTPTSGPVATSRQMTPSSIMKRKEKNRNPEPVRSKVKKAKLNVEEEGRNGN